MVCQHCGEREATFHLTKTVNGEKTELHLCPRCAEQQGTVSLPFQAPSIHQLLASLIGSSPGSPPLATPDKKAGREPICPGCGMSYAHFAETGRMGCSQCYETFSQQLQPLLRKVHSASEHTGKAPKRAAGPLKLKREIAALRKELQVAVNQEDFERAAQLRDRVRSLEQQSQAAAQQMAAAQTEPEPEKPKPRRSGRQTGSTKKEG